MADKNKLLDKENNPHGDIIVKFLIPNKDPKDTIDNFGNQQKFFGKFLFAGRYLAFFKSEKTTEIPVFYIKMLDIESVEDGFNQNSSDFYVEYLIPGKADPIKIIMMITDSTERDTWTDAVNQYKENFDEAFTSEKDELDYAMNEAEIKYMLTEEYEKILIEENIANYDFNKLLEHEPLKFDMIYNVDEDTGLLKEGGADQYIFYGRCKVYRKKGVHVTKERTSFPGGDLFGAKDAFIVLGLNKVIPPKFKSSDTKVTEAITLDDFKKVNRTRLLPKWMDYNYVYVIPISDVKGKKKPNDEIFPYIYKVDLFEYAAVKLVDCEKMVVQFQRDKEAVVFVFDHILECIRFFRMSRKAKQNIHEMYYIGSHEIRINVDLCENFSDSLVRLRQLLKRIIGEIYDKITLVNDEKVLRKFSEELHKYMVGFNCKETMEHKYLALFLEQFQTVYFQKVREGLTEAVAMGGEDMENMILDLINNCKFHEEFLKKWKIYDRRKCYKILEDVYNKMYFNRYAPEILNLIDQLEDVDYCYYQKDKRISYILIQFFNQLKKMLNEINNIRKDRDFQLNQIRLVKRALLLFFYNLLFLSENENSLEVQNMAIFLNAFHEVETKFHEFIMFFKEEYNIKNRMLKHFFNKIFFVNLFNEIRGNMERSVGGLFERQFKKFFDKIENWDFFKVNLLEREVMKKVNDEIKHFREEFHPNIENYFITTLNRQLIMLIIRNHTTHFGLMNFEYKLYKKSVDQFVQTVNNYEINDKLSKIQNAKILKGLENFFESQNPDKIEQSLFLLTFIIKSKEDMRLLTTLIHMKKFDDKPFEQKMNMYVQSVVRQMRLYSGGVKLKNRVFMYFRILNNINKMANKIWDRAQAQGIIQSDEEEIPGDDPENPQIKKIYRLMVGGDEGGKKDDEEVPKELKEVNLPSRFFNYKKKVKSDFNYIRTKIRTLQFDNRVINSSSGRLYIRDAKDKTQIQKVLLICKFTFAEKYEKIYSLLYFKSNMMLIIEFPDEKANESYLASFDKQMEFYKKKKVTLKKTQISDESTVNKQLKFLIDYNTKYKFDFPFSDLLHSHKGLVIPDRDIFFFKERRNPKKVTASALSVKPEEEEGKEGEVKEGEELEGGEVKSQVLKEDMEGEEGEGEDDEDGEEGSDEDEDFDENDEGLVVPDEEQKTLVIKRRKSLKCFKKFNFRKFNMMLKKKKQAGNG